MIERFTAQRATSPDYALAEGAVWNATQRQVGWIDIPRGELIVGELANDLSIAPVRTRRIDATVGALAVATDGTWVVGGAESLIVAGESLHQLTQVLPHDSGRRLNDGTADPHGRYLVGTASLSDPHEGNSLWCWDPVGGIRLVRSSVLLSNGVGFSPSGQTIYHVDSKAYAVDHASYDPTTGTVGKWQRFTDVTDGQPDGLTIDSDGCLWVAIWGAGRVRRYSPHGEVLAEIAVDAPLTSSVAFAGQALDIIVITTARRGLDDATLRAYPDAGALFTARSPVRGMHAHRVRLSEDTQIMR